MWHAGVRGGSVVLEAVLPLTTGQRLTSCPCCRPSWRERVAHEWDEDEYPKVAEWGHPRLQPG